MASPYELAARGKIGIDDLLDTLFGLTPITPATAEALERIFEQPATHWLELQKRADEASAHKKPNA